MQEYEIEFYDKADGSEPAKEFILSLDKKMQAKVLRTVALLREEGPFLREPYSKALDDGIFEIASVFYLASGQYRIRLLLFLRQIYTAPQIDRKS